MQEKLYHTQAHKTNLALCGKRLLTSGLSNDLEVDSNAFETIKNVYHSLVQICVRTHLRKAHSLLRGKKWQKEKTQLKCHVIYSAIKGDTKGLLSCQEGNN